jgi:hypothetical protein
VDPLALFLDVVPYSSPAPEDGLLGVFPDAGDRRSARRARPGRRAAHAGVPKAALQSKLARYDLRATRASLDAFAKYLSEKAGKPIAPSAQGSRWRTRRWRSSPS